MAVISVSKAILGTEPFAPHFKIREFACNDGADLILIETQFAYYMPFIREHFGDKSMHINSAYRTASYNAKVGGASESYHMKGMAVDFYIDGVNPTTVYNWLSSWWPGGVGKYPTFTHIDFGPRRRWVG